MNPTATGDRDLRGRGSVHLTQRVGDELEAGAIGISEVIDVPLSSWC
jgi:hypothetical protein